LFLAQITLFITLEQEIVNLLVSAQNADFFWFFFALHNRHFWQEPLDADWMLLERWELFLIFFISSSLFKIEVQRIKLQYVNTCLNKSTKKLIFVEVGRR
jgi:hypothetical protein